MGYRGRSNYDAPGLRRRSRRVDLRDTIYLNTATMCMGSVPVREAYNRATERWVAGRFDWIDAEEASEAARRCLVNDQCHRPGNRPDPVGQHGGRPWRWGAPKPISGPSRQSDMLHAFPRLATITLTIVAILIVVTQCRRPWSPIGRGFAWLMNRTHAGVTRWGLSHVTVGAGDTILDVGCGGGQTVRTLAGMGRMVHGIDYSPVSVAAATSKNADLIAAGRVQIRQASVSQLPFPDGTFDLVTAVETHFFWPDPANDFKEVLRVLKPGGTVLVIAETYKGQTFSPLMILPMLLVRGKYLSVEEHRELLGTAGFTDIQIDRIPLKGWICAVGRRPVAVAAAA